MIEGTTKRWYQRLDTYFFVICYCSIWGHRGKKFFCIWFEMCREAAEARVRKYGQKQTRFADACGHIGIQPWCILYSFMHECGRMEGCFSFVFELYWWSLCVVIFYKETKFCNSFAEKLLEFSKYVYIKFSYKSL